MGPNRCSFSPSSTIQPDFPSLLSLALADLGDLPGGVTLASLLKYPDPSQPVVTRSVCSLLLWAGLPRGTQGDPWAPPELLLHIV